MNNTLNYQEIISELKSIQETKKEFIYETRNYKINELYNYCQKFKYNIDLNSETDEFIIKIFKNFIYGFTFGVENPKTTPQINKIYLSEDKQEFTVEYYYLNPKK